MLKEYSTPTRKIEPASCPFILPPKLPPLPGWGKFGLQRHFRVKTYSYRKASIGSSWEAFQAG